MPREFVVLMAGYLVILAAGSGLFVVGQHDAAAWAPVAVLGWRLAMLRFRRW